MASITFLESGTDATGDLSFYSSTAGTVSSATDQAHTGPRSIKLSTGNPASAAQANTPVDVLADAGRRVSFWVRFAGTISGTGDILVLDNSSGNDVYAIRLRSDGLLVGAPIGATNQTGTATLVAGTWYRITVAYTITDTTTFRFDTYVNGVADTSTTTGTLTRTGTSMLQLRAAASLGNDVDVWFDDIYVDDGSDYADPGDIRVTAKKPSGVELSGFDAAIGAARGGSDYNNVNEVPASETNGWLHRGVAWVANGSLATTATITTLTITAPACSVNDILIAFIYGANNQAVSPPDGTWTLVSEANNGTDMRHSIFWKRATASGGTFGFTKPTDDNLLFAGFIGAWKGCRINGSPIDASSPTVSTNASSDDVTYATFDPTEANAFIIAAGFYDNDLTTAGAIAGTDPAFTNRADLETNIGSDCSIFVYEGVSSGAATGARSHSTTSSANAVNNGVLFGLVPQAYETYNLQAADAGDTNIKGLAIVGRTAWLLGKISSTAGAPAAALVDNGADSAITLTTSTALYTVTTTSPNYPSDVKGIGMRSAGTIADTSLYECGTILAYVGVLSRPVMVNQSRHRSNNY